MIKVRLMVILSLALSSLSCASTKSFTLDEMRSAAIQDPVNCESLSEAPIYLDIVLLQSEENWVEVYDKKQDQIKQVSLIKDGTFDLILKQRLHDFFLDECGAIPVERKDEAVYVIKIDVLQYYSQLLETKKGGDETFFGPNDEYKMDFEEKRRTALT